MGLDVDPPDPPSVTNRSTETPGDDADGGVADERRRDVEEALESGAWADAVAEWATYTDLTETEYAALVDLEVFAEFDFYWDATDGGVEFEVPSVPEDWDAVLQDLDLDAERARTAELSLSELGQTVATILEETALEWDRESEGIVWGTDNVGDATDRDNRELDR